MSTNSFGTRQTFTVGGDEIELYSLRALETGGYSSVARLPYSLKILLENMLRREDGGSVTADDIAALARWTPGTGKEIAFMPARVLLQDFTGVPAIVDLAAMRDGIARLGGDPDAVNPLQPAELVIDHSVQVDHFGTPSAFELNAEVEFSRNRERYAFLKWGTAGVSELQGCAARHRDRSSDQHRVSGARRLPRRVERRPPSRTPTPSSVPTRTRPWSTVWAWSAGAWAESRPRPPCSVSRSRC